MQLQEFQEALATAEQAVAIFREIKDRALNDTMMKAVVACRCPFFGPINMLKSKNELG